MLGCAAVRLYIYLNINIFAQNTQPLKCSYDIASPASIIKSPGKSKFKCSCRHGIVKNMKIILPC